MIRKYAIVVSLVVMVILVFGLVALMDKFGIPFHTDYGEAILVENFLYDEEKTGSLTDIGLLIIIYSAIVGRVIYLHLFDGKKYSHLVTLIYASISFVVITILLIILHSFKLHPFVDNALSFILTIGIGWFLFNPYDNDYTIGCRLDEINEVRLKIGLDPLTYKNLRNDQLGKVYNLKTFHQFLFKLHEKNQEVGQCFSRNITFVDYNLQEHLLTWDSKAMDKDKELLSSNFPLILSILNEGFRAVGTTAKIKLINKSDVSS